ncbi:MAG: hypothetical protein DWI45_03720 [Chloroflexi bacterium]|nr:MAG: hypothetical protein DWI45_03720 [Chloroflexota bacterium]
MGMIRPRPQTYKASWVLLAALLAASLLWGCAPAPSVSEEPSSSPVGTTASIRIHASGIPNPTDADELPDGSLIVGAQDGRIFHVAKNGTVEKIGDLSSSVINSGERGLLGVALEKADATPNELKMYATYIRRSDGDTVLVAATLSVRPYRILKVSEPLIAIAHYNTNHNGGDIVVLPDGRLIVSAGDSGGSGDPLNASQNLESNLGKLLLVDVRQAPTESRVIARGLRNPWRITLDPERSTLWIADVGQDTIEEVDRMMISEIGSPSATIPNFGWPILEGNECFRKNPCTPPRDYLAPIATYRHGPACSIIGGAVARGQYFFADYCDTRVFALPLGAAVGSEPAEVLSLGDASRPSALFASEDGRIWILDVGRGQVLELVLAP